MKTIRNSLVLLLVFPIFLFGWLPLSDMRSVHAAESNQLIFTPVADAYVNQSAPSTNYGQSTQLRIDGSPLVNSYLRFNISGLDGRVISRAVFQIYANSNLNGGYQIHPVSENSWAETTINYLNAPPMGDSLAASETISSGHWIKADITPILTGEGQLSLALTDSTVTAVSLASRETKTNAPQLIVTLVDSAGPSDTPSPTAADPSDTAIPTPTVPSTATFTPTPTFIQQPTFTPTRTYTQQPTVTPTLTYTQPFTFTPTPTYTRTVTPTPSRTSSPSPTLAFTQTPGYNLSVFTPAADAYVDSSKPGVNNGTQTTIRVDGSPFVNSYLRFNLSGLSGPVSQARLRIYANSASTSGISASGVTDNSWLETGITYANAPEIGNVVATSSAVGAGTWKELDVTGLINGNGLVSIGLKTFGSTAISLASRESGINAPQLLVTYLPGGQTSTIIPTITPTNTSTAHSTATYTPTGTSTPTSNPTPVVILAAGDLTKCGGGTPNPTGGAMVTSNMVMNASGSFFSLGDNSNDTGTVEDYENCYGPTWGRVKGRTYPAMGNHDQIADPQGGPYFAYFNGMTGNYGHYSLNLGTWHIVVLNAECAVGNQGCGAGSPQVVWLKQDLAANTRPCIMAIWHQPLFSSGTQDETPGMQTFWNELYVARADIVLNGHNHNYERFALQNPVRNSDPNGIREFVVGTGGASLDTSTKPMAVNEEVRSAAAYGYIKLTLKTNSYDWQFIAQPGVNFTDSGSGTCH